MTTGRREIWLRGNRRVYATVLFPTLLILISSTVIISGTVLDPPFWLRMVAAGVSGFAAVVTVSLIYWFQRPLLAYQNGFLLVYLSPPAVNRIPIEFVEVFLPAKVISRYLGPYPHRRTPHRSHETSLCDLLKVQRIFTNDP